jgi:bla regulator protein BlaR1
MLSALGNHLWQSTLFAEVVWLLTLALRNDSARLRHGLWLAASLKFLIPLSLLITLGGQIHWRKAPVATELNVLVVMDQVSEPFTAPAVALPASPPARSHLPAIVFVVWACGFIGITASWWFRWRRLRTAARAASPLHLELPIQARSSPLLMEPGVFGVFRPILLLPEGIADRLPPAQLQAVIAHELCHVRHRDNLIAAIHMFVETVFWFHPLIWWIGKRMVEERERACDEEVLSMTGEPKAYAEGILNVCKLYVESPLECVAGVTGGSNLKRRIEAIMSNRIVLQLSIGKKFALTVAGIAALAVPIAIGILNAPRIEAQSRAQSNAQSAPTPKFEVVSIKPSTGCVSGARSGSNPTPGRLTLTCETVASFIGSAYVRFANGRFSTQPRGVPMSGGPAWINSELYMINAKAEGLPSEEMMRGPMMQAILEDRFKLKVHRETREVPVYALTEAKGGSKLQPFREGSCIVIDRTAFPPPPADPKNCHARGTKKGPDQIVEAQGITVEEFSKVFLNGPLDRPVINKTGITGRFDFHLEYAPDEATPLFARPDVNAPDRGPSIFTAVQEQLGLKLEPAKGPGELLVIDRVERPSEN